MKITSIKYTERKNLGNYEHSEVSAEAILDDLDNVGIATQNLINFESDLFVFEGSSKQLEMSLEKQKGRSMQRVTPLKYQ
jgi:hypothetical protein